jgi:hypothetical protein
MPKVLSEPTVIELERVFRDQAERIFREALEQVEKAHKRQVKEVMYLAYETMLRGKFGDGPFNVSITCNEQEYIIRVKEEV